MFYHVYLVATNKTTNEDLNNVYETEPNPFHLVLHRERDRVVPRERQRVVARERDTQSCSESELERDRVVARVS